MKPQILKLEFRGVRTTVSIPEAIYFATISQKEGERQYQLIYRFNGMEKMSPGLELYKASSFIRDGNDLSIEELNELLSN